MNVFQQGISTLQTILEGYGQDNAASKNQGIKQLVAGGGIILIGTKLVPMLSGMLN